MSSFPFDFVSLLKVSAVGATCLLNTFSAGSPQGAMLLLPLVPLCTEDDGDEEEEEGCEVGGLIRAG